MRPNFSDVSKTDTYEDATAVFDRVCPGKRVAAPESEDVTQSHPVFGRSVGVWEGWATDPEIRRAGSSGGVLTTISSYISTETRNPAQMVAMDDGSPSRSVPVRIMSRDEALKAAGSRYAPVSVGAGDFSGLSSVTGKPCEVSAIRAAGSNIPSSPVLLSFFCAGTPSQNATDSLVERLGHSVDNLSSTKYRGDGWPGQFVVTSADGSSGSMSYEESWGAVLGKQLQERCKICVDGTGESADIAVGDFWESDDSGYPLFEDSEGRSVVIARSIRGLKIIEECVDKGLLELRPIDLDEVATIQPLQVKRRLSLPGRMMGRILTGQRVPSYPGYNLARIFAAHPRINIRALGGTIRRKLKSQPSRA
ncbi:Coenzyme F420 hydrogenase/dehydrogenase, beta subunit C-terminal domain [Pseudarthrobacter oxydans]|uniref:Coenzyme F420 hydrogenase/dehydrogenase, beta subunit C-terminal domain n=1 Tax=Pseudarthrobacter oxydans TaxID=1671 RepID=UPI00380A26B8